MFWKTFKVSYKNMQYGEFHLKNSKWLCPDLNNAIQNQTILCPPRSNKTFIETFSNIFYILRDILTRTSKCIQSVVYTECIQSVW